MIQALGWDLPPSPIQLGISYDQNIPCGYFQLLSCHACHGSPVLSTKSKSSRLSGKARCVWPDFLCRGTGLELCGGCSLCPCSPFFFPWPCCASPFHSLLGLPVPVEEKRTLNRWQLHRPSGLIAKSSETGECESAILRPTESFSWLSVLFHGSIHPSVFMWILLIPVSL